MIDLCLGELFEMVGDDLDIKYSADEIEQLSDTVEEIIEDWLDEVFDKRARLFRQEFLDIVAKQGSWIFDAAQIRAKAFAKSGVQVKHIKKKMFSMKSKKS